MSRPEGDDVALRLLHTADWHLGRRFPSFDEADRTKLSRARLDVLDQILLKADHESADALLCAGDLFEEPDLEREWWEPVAKKLTAMRPRPVFLLPGNHDPLQPGSVYYPGHSFRRALPPWVHVVDRDDFEHELKEGAVLYACPCRSRAGQRDPALALPPRAPGDERIRIGLVHGSTFDAVDCQTNFPIAKDAALLRGFDYLAIGDTHSFRDVPPGARPPVVYPGAPEATTFGEPGAGNVVAVFVSQSRRVTFRPERVAYWTWSERMVRSLAELRALASEPHLARTVLRLVLDLRLTAPEMAEAEAILTELKGTAAAHGRAGILQVMRERMTLDTRGIEVNFADLPEVVRATVAQLQELERGDQAEVAREALFHLFRLVRAGGAS
ncbi:MAG: DNA repair exonuclease [Kofleriaceae bacterium]|jgi:DNA repair exonuclease SbcCD nuclease subunit|nr:DNA repair exonuclease [Kofleriaceae bacterium]